MSRPKRCARCHHPKSHHRVGWCRHQSTGLRDSGYGPWHVVTTDCMCSGYIPREAHP